VAPNSQPINASMISLFTLRNFILPKLLDHIKVIILRNFVLYPADCLYAKIVKELKKFLLIQFST
jgi:hypothetical protein